MLFLIIYNNRFCTYRSLFTQIYTNAHKHTQLSHEFFSNLAIFDIFSWVIELIRLFFNFFYFSEIFLFSRNIDFMVEIRFFQDDRQISRDNTDLAMSFSGLAKDSFRVPSWVASCGFVGICLNFRKFRRIVIKKY